MAPDLRAVISPRGPIRAVRWAPYLKIAGPAATLLFARERAGVAIADLTLVAEHDDAEDEKPVMREVIVEFLCGGTPAAREALAAWAALIGLRRVWFHDQVREVEPLPRGRVHVRCGACRLRLVDGVPTFWDWVSRVGYFPVACPLCGGDLPQWQAVPAPRAARPSLSVVADDPVALGDLRVSDHRQDGRP